MKQLSYALIAFLGLACSITPSLAQIPPQVPPPPWRLGVMVDQTLLPGKSGLMIHSVFAGSPAEALDLKTGDEIVYVDGKPMASVEAVRASIKDQQASELIVKRNGGFYTLQAMYIAETGVPKGAPPKQKITGKWTELKEKDLPKGK